MNYPMPSINLSAILPEIFLTISACAVLLADLYVPSDKKETVGLFSIVGLVVTFFLSLQLFGKNEAVFDGMYMVDNYAVFFKLAFVAISILVILISLSYLKTENIRNGEYYALILFSTIGMMVMAGGGDLITIYLGLELMALSSYALVGIMKNNSRSLEACLKYFLTGAFASAILLYGVAFLYGLTGTTSIVGINEYLTANGTSSPLLMLSLILILAGFSFKVAAAPFHIWAPDVYEGAPTSITAFLTVGSKFAGFAAMVRVLMIALIAAKPYWVDILSVVAILTMTIGNITALYQSNLKRLLAYSSIAHAGYILIGVVAGSQAGMASVLFYSIAYGAMNIGAFAILILVNSKDNRGFTIDSFKGLSKTHPVIALVTMIFFLSLAGIPPTAGFAGKFYLFSAAIQADLVWLALIAGINSVISVYYYLRVIMVMYMDEPEGEPAIDYPHSLIIALSIMVFAVVAIGLFPNSFFEAAKQSVLL